VTFARQIRLLSDLLRFIDDGGAGAAREIQEMPRLPLASAPVLQNLVLNDWFTVFLADGKKICDKWRGFWGFPELDLDLDRPGRAATADFLKAPGSPKLGQAT